jgi:hypothetical protein
MRTLKAPPREATLFDLEATAWWSTQLSPSALRHLQTGWQGLFQRTILGLLQQPAEALGRHLDAELGRPSKDLYALSGLLLIAEFKNWTIDEAAEAWSLDAGLQFALSLPRDRQYLCPRTLDTYRRSLREDGAVQEIFTTVTAALVQALEIDIARQRLDSTHVLSQMAQLTRLQLLAVAVRRFLRAVQKHDAPGYAAVPEELRARYEPAETRLFGLGTKKPQPREEALQQVAEDLAWLVTHFAGQEAQARRTSDQALVRLLAEHCTVAEGRTVLRPQSQDAEGGSAHCLQNPSDPDAGYSGHKGAGHQVQIAQTLPPRDVEGKIEGPGLITACVPQSAAVRDNEALAEVFAQQQSAGLLPAELLADTIYGSDANVTASAAVGVVLISPVCGAAPKPEKKSKHHCHQAERELKARLHARREAQETPEWQAQYRLRSGLEGVHHAVDVMTGMKRLRVRGEQAVRYAVTLKVTGWNIQAAAKTLARRARKRAAAGQGGENRRFQRRRASPRALRCRGRAFARATAHWQSSSAKG